MSLVDEVRRAVSAVSDPELRRPLGELNMVREVTVDGDTAHVEIALTIAGCPAAQRIESDARNAASAVPGIAHVEMSVSVFSPAERAALTERLRGVAREPFGPDSLTRVIAVTSGKGGVGKSTVTANLAVALAARGLAVGLIDADVHGFSIPGLLGLVDAEGRAPQPTRLDSLILPAVAHGVKVISIAMFLRAGESAVAWRGPMLHRTVQQFLRDVHFGELDVLLLDMPPGTGDVAISVGQLLPHAEVLVVTTPQAAAADIAARSGSVAAQTGQRVIGVVENMAPMALPDGTVLDLFGSGGGEATARALSTADHPVRVLGSVPLSTELRRCGDAGTPIVLAQPEDPAAVAIAQIAEGLLIRSSPLAGRPLPLRVQ